jgi:hypothetical protein
LGVFSPSPKMDFTEINKSYPSMKKFIIPALILSLLANIGLADEKKKDVPAEKAAKAKVEKPKADKPKGEKAEKKEKAPQPDLVDVTLTGKLSKKETTGKGDKKYTFFYLETSDGQNVRLNQTALGKKSTIKLDDFVDANVTVRGKGYTKELKNKKKQTYVKEISAIEK